MPLDWVTWPGGASHGIYRRSAGEPVFQEARVPTSVELHGVLDKIITRLMKIHTRQGYLLEEQGMTCLAERVAP